MNLCLNYIPTDEGALVRRSGFRFSAEARADTTQLIPFLTAGENGGDSLICELSAGVIRFHTAGSLRVDLPRNTVVGISTATPAVVETLTAHGYTSGNTVVFSDLGPDTAPYLFQRQFRITVLSATTFSIAHTGSLGTGPVNGSVFSGALFITEQVAAVTENGVEYAEAEIGDIKYTEEGNNLYLFQKDHRVHIIDGTSLVVTATPTQDGPYLDENTTATTLTFSGVSGSVTVTASSTTGINGGSGFQTTDVHRVIRVNTGTADAPDWSWLRITARSSTTVVTATVLGPNLASAAANTKWRLGLYSDTTGHPTHGVIHENRLWLISDAAPGRIDASRTVDGFNNTTFFNFAPTTQDGTVVDSSAISASFSGAGRKNLYALQVTDSGLLALSDSSEWLIRASSFDDPLTPFTIQARQVTNYGAADAMAARAGRNVLFIQALGRAVMELRSDRGEVDGNDIARRARHLTAAGVAEIALSKVPVPILWARRADQRLIGCSYRNDLEGQQAGWHRHNMAWADDPVDVDSEWEEDLGPVTSIAVAPFSDVEGTRNDVLWIAVDRNGQTCVEYLMPSFDDTLDPNEAFFVDSGTVYTQENLETLWQLQSGNTYRFYGLDRLVGDTVDVLFRGIDVGSGTVQAGGYVEITLSDEALSTAAAYQVTTVTQATGGALTFSSNFVSNIEEDVIVRQKPFNPAQAFAVGEDGELYYTARPKTGDPNGIYLIAAADGSLADSVSSATIVADLAADGVEPPGGWVGSSPTAGEYSYVIPGTKYILVDVVDSSGLNTNHGWAYYKIDGSGQLVYVGGWAEDPTGTSFQFVPGDDYNSLNMLAMGFHTRETTASDLRTDSPILLAGYAESKTIVVPIPSPAYIEANSPVNVTTAGNVQARTANTNITADFPTFDHLFENSDGTEIPIRTSQGFFLPGPGDITYLFAYVNQELMEEHAASTESVTVPAIETQSGVSTDPIIIEMAMTGTDHTDMRVASARVTGADRFENFPFPDIGEGFSGGAGASELNDYGNPSVFPSDAADPTKPWYVFFPRRYPDGTDNRDKLGIRAYLWDPTGGADRRGYATHLSFAKGKLYDVTTNGLPGTQSLGESVSIYWDRTDNKLYVLSTGVTSASSDTVVSQFGTFVPATGQVSSIDDGHVDGVIGLNYHSRGQILRPDLNSGAQNGPGLGKRRRTDRFNGLFYRTGRIDFGTRFDDLILLKLGDLDSVGRRALFSGVSDIRSLQDSYTYDSMMAWEQSRPEPGAIVALAGHIQTQDL
jgi:hypothetical protein